MKKGDAKGGITNNNMLSYGDSKMAVHIEMPSKCITPHFFEVCNTFLGLTLIFWQNK